MLVMYRRQTGGRYIKRRATTSQDTTESGEQFVTITSTTLMLALSAIVLDLGLHWFGIVFLIHYAQNRSPVYLFVNIVNIVFSLSWLIYGKDIEVKRYIEDKLVGLSAVYLPSFLKQEVNGRHSPDKDYTTDKNLVLLRMTEKRDNSLFYRNKGTRKECKNYRGITFWHRIFFCQPYE